LTTSGVEAKPNRSVRRFVTLTASERTGHEAMAAKPFFVLLALLMAGVLAAAETVPASSPSALRALRRGNGPEPSTLDAHRAQDLASHNVLRDLYEGLVSEDARGQLLAGMAERWEISADGRRYAFHLRRNLRWSNGEPLLAAEIVASFQRALSPATAAPLAPMLAVIVGARELAAGTGTVADLAIRASDPHTLLIDLVEPAPLLQLLLLPIAYPVYLPALARYGSRHTRPGNLVSNGAYQLLDWQPHALIRLQKNAHFHAAAAVAIADVRYLVTEDAASEQQRFRANDLDLTETVPPARRDRLQARFGAQLRISPYLGSFFLGLNLRAAVLGRAPALREALSLAIDREILTRYITALGETPAYALVPPGMADYPAPKMASAAWSQAARETRARQLYAAAGYRAEAPLTIEIRYNTSTPHRRLALAVAAMWRQVLGAKVVLRNEEWKSFVLHRREGRITQVFRGGWIADVEDPLSFLALFDGDQALNWSGWHDPVYRQWLAQARQADGGERQRLLAGAEQRLLDQHVIVPIYFYTSKHLVRTDVLGFEANPLDRHGSRWLHFAAPAGAR